MEAKLFIFAAVAISQVFSACAPTNAKFSNFWKSPKRRIPFNIGVIAKRCPGLNEFYYLWTVEEYPGLKTVLTSRKASLYIDGYTFDSNRVFTLQYKITVKISHYPDLTFPDDTSGIFQFTPDEMHIEIAGGLRKTHRLGKDLIVDAKTLSRDSSYPPEEDAFEGNIVKWVIDPEIKGYKPPNNLVLTIPQELLKLNDLYEFVLSVNRTKIPNYEDFEIKSQTVLIRSYNAPEINIKCIRNCVRPHHLVATAFGINCTKNCEDIQYLWKIEPEPPPESIQFGNGYDKIVINDKTFKEGDQVYVTFLEGLYPHMISLTFASGLEQGNCTIRPSEGISAVTKFTLKCEGFSSPNGLSLCMVFQTDGFSPVNIILHEFSYAEESDLFIAPGNPSELFILVEDHAFLNKMVEVSATVKQFVPPENIPVEAAIKKFVLEKDASSVLSSALEGLHDEAVQLISCLLDAIYFYDLDDDTTRDLHKHMVEALLQSQTFRVSSALQNLWILYKIQNYKKDSDSVTSRLLGEVLLRTTIDVHQLYVHKQSVLFPQYYIKLLHKYTLFLCSDFINPVQEIMDILSDEIPPHDYDSYDEFISKKIQIRDDYRRMTKNVIVAMQTNSLSALHQNIPGEKAYNFNSETIVITSQRLNLYNFTDGIITIEEEEEQQPLHPTNSLAYLPNEIVENLRKEVSYVDYQFAVFFTNPFWWHKNISTLNTRVTLFEFFIKCDRIQRFSTPFLIKLDITKVPAVKIDGFLSNTDISGYSIELQPNAILVIEFYNQGEHPYDYLVTWSDCFCTEDDFSSDRSQVIKNGTNERQIMKVENGNSVKIIYNCIKKLTPKLSYHFELSTFTCMHWDFVEEHWHREGCRAVDPALDIEIMICECYHSSLFVGEIIAPPTTLIVNLEINFSLSFAQNYVMVAFISGLVILWLVFLILAHLKDKSMKERNVVYKLDDNVPGDSNPYLVVVFTGCFYDAQTTADVAFKLIGELSQSRTHVIKSQGTTLLKRNSQDWLMIYSPTYLGHLKKIKIWHNCKGRYPHWYCDRVIVQDLKVGEQYCFTVKKWFSVIWGSGRIYREVRLNSSSTKISDIFFRTRLERDLKNEHIWLSILTRDFQSNFNSKERVSTGFCFLFLSMLANAMLLSAPHDAPSDSIDEQGTFDINLSKVIIFILSWIVAIPVSLLILFIFKNSAPL